MSIQDEASLSLQPTAESLHRLELIVSQLLRIGVLISGGLLFIGWIGMWYNGNDITGNMSVYNPTSFTDTLQWAMIMRDRWLLITLLGLVVLVTLPVIRVFLTAILFIKQKEFRLAGVALLVFLFLVGSFFLGVDL